LSKVPVVCGILLAGLVVDKLFKFSCVGIWLVVDWGISVHYSLGIYINTIFLRSTGLIRPYCSESKEEVISKYELRNLTLEEHQFHDRDITLLYIRKPLCDIIKLYGNKLLYVLLY
jgi:hypothetical protein